MADEVLTPAERAEVARIVGATVTGEEVVWERPQVVRITTAEGRFIAKRPRPEGDTEPTVEARSAYLTELAALELLSSMPDSPAPRLLGAGDDVDLLVIEHLPPAPSVADALLGDDNDAAEAGVVGLAETLARVHSWTSTRESDYQAIRRRIGLPADEHRWSKITGEGVEGLRRAATAWGVEVPASFEEECEDVVARLRAPGWWRALVHGDPCPDNTSVTAAGVRLFDFEYTNFGSALLDASYVVAPFPTCWCFGRIPPDLTERAAAAYRVVLAAAHPEAIDDSAWREALATALSSWLIARGRVLVTAAEGDREWGTTTMRPRLLQWMDAFLSVEAPHLPSVTAVVETLRAKLAVEWVDARLPDYPALPTPGDHSVVVPPAWWKGWRADA